MKSPARLRQGYGGSAEAKKGETERRRKGEPEPSALGSSRARSEGALGSGMGWGPAARKGDFRPTSLTSGKLLDILS
jgi:hypothetical protein